eukprot:4186993-Amphidinium_carterae.1
MHDKPSESARLAIRLAPSCSQQIALKLSRRCTTKSMQDSSMASGLHDNLRIFSAGCCKGFSTSSSSTTTKVVA